MVDAHAAGVTQDGAQHIPIRRITGFGQAPRVPRRLAPVLTLLIEAVGRRADADPLCQCIFEHLRRHRCG